MMGLYEKRVLSFFSGPVLSSSRWTARENRRQKAGSRTRAIPCLEGGHVVFLLLKTVVGVGAG